MLLRGQSRLLRGTRRPTSGLHYAENGGGNWQKPAENGGGKEIRDLPACMKTSKQLRH